MATLPPLTTAAELADYPGSPYLETLVSSAAASVRDEAGWHIAPLVTETLVLDSQGGRRLILPSLQIDSVAEVRDVTGDTPAVLEGWRLSRRACFLYLEKGWPTGVAAVEVDLTHGCEACPEDLLAVVAERVQQLTVHAGVAQESLAGRSMTANRQPSPAAAAIIDRYRV